MDFETMFVFIPFSFLFLLPSCFPSFFPCVHPIRSSDPSLVCRYAIKNSKTLRRGPGKAFIIPCKCPLNPKQLFFRESWADWLHTLGDDISLILLSSTNTYYR